MKLLPVIAALAGAVLAVTPAAAAPTFGDVLSCTGTGLGCSSKTATIGASTEFTGNFGGMSILGFYFSDGLLKISNATTHSYGVVADMRLNFQDLTNAFTTVSLVSDNGFYGLSQANFTIDDGALSFSTPFFSAAQNATMTLKIDSAGPVPEPASWAMMILGVGMVGITLRRAGRSWTATVGAA